MYLLCYTKVYSKVSHNKFLLTIKIQFHSQHFEDF